MGVSGIVLNDIAIASHGDSMGDDNVMGSGVVGDYEVDR